MNNAQQLVPLDAATLQDTLSAWKQRWPQAGVLALLPEAEKHQAGLLQQCSRECGVPVYGAIFPALVTDHGFVTRGVWLLAMETMPPVFMLDSLEHDGSNRMAMALASAQAAMGDDDGSSTVMLFFDSMIPNIGTLMETLHLKLRHPPRYVGVNAGSETFQPMPCLFDNEQIIGNGVLGFLLPSHVHSVVQHSYPVSKSLMHATSAEGNRIVTIDGKPAFEVYQSVLQQEYGVALTRDNFYEYAVHFPFGVVMAIDVLVRIPVALADDGALICVGEIAPNSRLRLLRAPTLDASRCVPDICSHLQEMFADPGDLLTFYCAGRRMHFGDQAGQELQQLKDTAGNRHLFGALSLGEIDSLEDLGFPRFHNAAIVCLARELG